MDQNNPTHHQRKKKPPSFTPQDGFVQRAELTWGHSRGAMVVEDSDDDAPVAGRAARARRGHRAWRLRNRSLWQGGTSVSA
jgi:hypothetical protein